MREIIILSSTTISFSSVFLTFKHSFELLNFLIVSIDFSRSKFGLMSKSLLYSGLFMANLINLSNETFNEKSIIRNN